MDIDLNIELNVEDILEYLDMVLMLRYNFW